MKKVLALFALISLSSCGFFQYLEERESYPVYFSEQADELVSSEYMEERAHPFNEVLTAYVGYSVIDKKIYRKNTYASEELKANKNGVMSGSTSSVKFKMNERKKILGYASVEAEEFTMIPADIDGYVILIDQEGRVYNKMGKIVKGSRVTLLTADFMVKPADFRFEIVSNAKSKQSRPEKGFDIKYDGIKLDRMIFTYLDYSKLDGRDRGYFENITFPLDQEYIEIEGTGFKVLKATKDKLDYVILK